MLFKHQNVVQIPGSYYIPEKVSAVTNPILNKETLKKFWHGYTFSISEIVFSDTNELIFSIGTAKKPNLGNNSYAIIVEENSVCISAKDEKSLIYGYITFLDIIEMDDDGRIYVKCCEIQENPYVRNRMVHFCVFPETELWEIERFVKLCGALKLSHIIIEFWGMFKYECMKELSWDNAFTKEQLKPVTAIANDLGIDIIPMFNHWGHASQSRQISGKHTILSQNPKLQYLFSEDGWRWKIGSSKVNTLFKDIRKELIEIFGKGEYFCIGCDEADGFTYTKEEMDEICGFLNEVTDDLSKYGRKPILWGDMFLYNKESFNKSNNYFTQAPCRESAEYMRNLLNKNVIFADWQYDAQNPPIETSVDLNESGFNVLVCPWNRHIKNGTACIDTIREYDLFGLLHTTWHTLSAYMPMLVKDACLCWQKSSATSSQRAENIQTYYTKTAAILRKIYPTDNDYEKSGWSKKQVGDIIN